MTLLWGLSLLLLSSPSAGQSATAAGVVVEEVQPGYSAHRAGLLAGDVLVGWERAAAPPAHPDPAQGVLDSPFDLLWVEREEAPRGKVSLRGTRGGAALLLQIPVGEWKLQARPALGEGELARYAAGKQLVASGELESGLTTWAELAAALRSKRSQGDATAARWLLAEAAAVAAKNRAWALVDRYLAEAAGDARAAGDGRSLALLQAAAGEAARLADEWDRALQAFDEALEALAALGEPSLTQAWIYGRLGHLEHVKGDRQKAEEHHRRALAIREERAPGSRDVAASYLNLGEFFRRRGEQAQAEDYFRRALALQEAVGDEVGIAFSLGYLGLAASSRGDLTAAEEYLRRVVEIDAPLRSQTVEFAITLRDLGGVAFRRGKLTEAEDLYRQALTKFQAHGTELDVAAMDHRLAGLAIERGELEAALAYSGRALATYERLAPESPDIGALLTRRGMISMASGDLTGAEADLRGGLAIKEKADPSTPTVRYTLNQLAALELARGNRLRAGEHLARALAIEERRGTLDDAGLTSRLLGDVALADGDLDAAVAHYQRSLERERQVTSGTVAEAESCVRLAALHRRRGQAAPALDFYRCALDAIEAQRRTLGGTDEVRAGFAARYARFYYDTSEVLLGMGRAEEAFHIVERYRARGLLALLAERDVGLDADLPPELQRERRETTRAYDSTVAALTKAAAADADRLRGELAAIRRRQAAVQDAIRAASPRLAALQYPQPLDVAGVRAILDPGTVLLSYLVGETGSYLFVLGPGGADFAVHPLAVRRDTLRADVTQLRELLQVPAPHSRGRLDALTRRLSDALLLPAAAAIRGAERLLILPDGPLHLLPFGALAAPSTTPRVHLAELRPLHVAASATVFAELKKERRAPAYQQLLAFADPDYSALDSGAHAAASPAEVRSARTRGLELRPLPGARREAAAVAAAHPGAARVYVGAEATEERFKQLAGQGTLIHLACHGLADERSPLDSSLALAMPDRWEAGRENGLLQAWEIFEQVRIDADLVALSACSSALGKEMSGEGILGLTRAFQYAGARSVLASLWQVNDASTAKLMAAFYRHLAAGRSKDAALQEAQRELIADRTTAHPHYWAAFQLNGDWR